MELYKCNKSTTTWFRSYLSNRFQLVQLNNRIFSQSDVIKCGVPQGSILGPLLFLIFINDLPLTVGDTVHSTDLYADDTTIYDIQDDVNTLHSNLSDALSSLNTWCTENGMRVNVDKTKVMIITTNQKRRLLTKNNFSLHYDNCVLNETQCEKILGINFQNDLKWDSHVTAICRKISSYLWLLSRIKDYVKLEYRILFYKAYIQPHLDYCSTLWGNTTAKNIRKLTRLQKRACRIMLGRDYCNFESSLEILNLQTFSQRVTFNQAVFMYKVVNNDLPDYICEMFSKVDCLSSENYRLRSNMHSKFDIPMPHLEIYKNSLLYAGSMLWNNLPVQIKEASSIKQFKRLYLDSPGAS